MRLAIVLVVLLGCGCGSKKDPAPEPAPTPAAGGWWCGERCFRVAADCPGCAHHAEARCFDWTRINGDHGSDCFADDAACAAARARALGGAKLGACHAVP